MKINKQYTLEVDVSGSEIAEAFGIEGGHILEIANDLDIPDEYDILYISGESGSGKSSILSEIGETTQVIIPNTPLYTWGCTTKETLSILSLVGLGDATMFVSTYSQLSDSQQARARLALCVLHGDSHIIVDEFLSTLDRKTAQAVAYTFGKAIRKLGLKATLVTAHGDLGPYLKPDVMVTGYAFPSRFTVQKPVWLKENPIVSAISMEYTNKEFYRNLRLGELHYKGKYTGGTKEYVSATLEGECIGILVSVYRMHDGGRRIARVVVHPSYRGCGVGVALVSRYIKDYPNSDVVAVMAAFNPVFEKAGMNRVEDSVIKSPKNLKKVLKDSGMNVNRWHEKRYCHEIMSSNHMRILLSDFAGFATHLVCPGGKNLTAEEVKKKITNDRVTASRVLWGLRERRLAKFVTHGGEDE